MYLTYERYKELGGTFSELEYYTYELLSESEINNITGGALPDTEIVEKCMMIMLEGYQKYDDTSLTGRAQTMSNDGVSVHYRSDTTAENALDIARSRIRLLLSNAKISTKSLAVKYRV